MAGCKAGPRHLDGELALEGTGVAWPGSNPPESASQGGTAVLWLLTYPEALPRFAGVTVTIFKSCSGDDGIHQRLRAVSLEVSVVTCTPQKDSEGMYPCPLSSLALSFSSVPSALCACTETF